MLCSDELPFLIWRFLSYLTWKTIIYCVTDQQSITRSQSSALNFKLSVLTFLNWWAAWWALSKNYHCAKLKKFYSKLCWMLKDVLIIGLCSRILVLLAWPWYLTWAIRDRQFKFCMQESCCRLQNTSSNMRIHIKFFLSQLIWTNGRVVKAGSRESVDMGSIP